MTQPTTRLRLSGTNLERAADHNQRVTLHGPNAEQELGRGAGRRAAIDVADALTGHTLCLRSPPPSTEARAQGCASPHALGSPF